MRLFEGYSQKELAKFTDFFTRMTMILCQLPENGEIAKRQRKLRGP
jgi:hypothetical protein